VAMSPSSNLFTSNCNVEFVCFWDKNNFFNYIFKAFESIDEFICMIICISYTTIEMTKNRERTKNRNREYYNFNPSRQTSKHKFGDIRTIFSGCPYLRSASTAFLRETNSAIHMFIFFVYIWLH
jgi:hypothetical protein